MSSSILVTEEGIDTLINFLHPRKHPLPIDETEEGIVIFSNEEHSKKTYDPIEVTEDGISFSFKDEHSENKLFSIFNRRRN